MVKGQALYVKIYDTGTQAVNIPQASKAEGCKSPSKVPPPILAR
jgi:hypothetical protein